MKKVALSTLFKMILAAVLLFMFSLPELSAQQVSRKPLSKKDSLYMDSLRNVDYQWVFPLWGQEVYGRGFDIPYPFGVMFNYFYGDQTIVIESTSIGFRGPDNTLEPVDLSEIIVFGPTAAIAHNLNVRADLFVFPFLNVYGLFGYSPRIRTSVELTEPFSLQTTAEQTAPNIGFGVMSAFGFGPVWLQADANFSWAFPELLDRPVLTNILGLRVGHTFVFPNARQKNIAVWAGFQRLGIDSDTRGEILLDNVFSDISQEKLDEIRESYENWYDDLNPLQKQVVDRIMETLQDKLDGVPIRDTYIIYELDKRVKQNWSGIIGAQYQLNKSWALRTEWSIIGDRFSVLASVNYRFLGTKKKP